MDSGSCRCGVVGDPLVIFYDGGAALLLDQKRYVLTYVNPNTTLYPCNFVVWVQTLTRADNLTIPEGISLRLKQGGLNINTVITQDGIWSSKFHTSDFFLDTNFTDEQTELDAELKFTKHDGGFFLDPLDDDCNFRLYVKMDGLFSKAAVYVNKTEFGAHLLGMCGNCNGDDSDDYDVLEENSDALNAPILISQFSPYVFPYSPFPSFSGN